MLTGGLKLNKGKIIEIKSPLDKNNFFSLNNGDTVSITGRILTGRDAFHKFAFQNYIKNEKFDSIYREIKKLLNNAFIYHCGPIMKKTDPGWKFIAGGPTTSIREEPYQSEIIAHFNLSGVIGKGGMGEKTQEGLIKNKAVYLHATGGAASLIANRVKKVSKVFFLEEFGIPEAVWVLDVENFLCTVTMDAEGNSLHEKIKQKSCKQFDNIIKGLK